MLLNQQNQESLLDNNSSHHQQDELLPQLSVVSGQSSNSNRQNQSVMKIILSGISNSIPQLSLKNAKSSRTAPSRHFKVPPLEPSVTKISKSHDSLSPTNKSLNLKSLSGQNIFKVKKNSDDNSQMTRSSTDLDVRRSMKCGQLMIDDQRELALPSKSEECFFPPLIISPQQSDKRETKKFLARLTNKRCENTNSMFLQDDVQLKKMHQKIRILRVQLPFYLKQIEEQLESFELGVEIHDLYNFEFGQESESTKNMRKQILEYLERTDLENIGAHTWLASIGYTKQLFEEDQAFYSASLGGDCGHEKLETQFKHETHYPFILKKQIEKAILIVQSIERNGSFSLTNIL